MPRTKKTPRGKVITKPAGSRKPGRPKSVDTVEKIVDKSPDEIRAAAVARRKDAIDYNKEAGALPGQRLVVKTKKGFILRWVRDDDKGGLDRRLRLGYYFVKENLNGEFIPTDDLGSRVKRRTGVREGGGPEFSFLMEMPEDIYREDQQTKEARIRVTEDEIRGGDGAGGGLASAKSLDGKGVAYDPTIKGGTKIGENNIKV